MTGDKKKVKPVVWAGISVGAATGIFVLIVAMMPAQASISNDGKELEIVSDRGFPKPNEAEFRTGIPMLIAFDIQKLETMYYHEVTEGQY